MAAKTQQLPPKVTHWFTAVKPITLTTKLRPTSTLSVLVSTPKPATQYSGQLHG